MRRLRRLVHRYLGRGTHFYHWSDVKATTLAHNGRPRCIICGRVAR